MGTVHAQDGQVGVSAWAGLWGSSAVAGQMCVGWSFMAPPVSRLLFCS